MSISNERNERLSRDEELARAGETKRQVEQYIPEIIPFLKDLHAVGLLSGWRKVRFRLLDDQKKGDETANELK